MPWERGRPALGCRLPSPAPAPDPEPLSSPGEGAFSKVRTRPAGTWGFFPAQRWLCNHIVKDHGRCRKSEQPHRSARGRIYFTAPKALRQTQDFGRGGDAEFQDARMWQKQTLPTHARCLLTGEGSSGLPSPRLQRSAGFCQGWDSFSLYRRKTRFKNTPLLWFSIKAHQRATGCGSERRQRDGGGGR